MCTLDYYHYTIVITIINNNYRCYYTCFITLFYWFPNPHFLGDLVPIRSSSSQSPHSHLFWCQLRLLISHFSNLPFDIYTFSKAFSHIHRWILLPLSFISVAFCQCCHCLSRVSSWHCRIGYLHVSYLVSHQVLWVLPSNSLSNLPIYFMYFIFDNVKWTAHEQIIVFQVCGPESLCFPQVSLGSYQ